MAAHHRQRRFPCSLALAALCAAPAAARAHHEAIFGPQSSLVLSAPGFVSFQTFTRQTGTAGAATQETPPRS